MALNKVTYVEGETKIHAQNLNDIQDEILLNTLTFEDELSDGNVVIAIYQPDEEPDGDGGDSV